MNFNIDRIQIKQEDPLKSDIFIDSLHEKISKKVELYRPSPEDFTDVYTQEEIDIDIENTKSLEKIFEIQNSIKNKEAELAGEKDFNNEKIKKISDILEGITTNQMSGDWLNNEVVTHPTSKFDDYNGVDSVLEFTEGKDESYIGLAIDFTFSSNSEIIDKKIDKIFKEIREDNIHTIKYFESVDEKYKGKINVARSLFVLDISTVRELFILEKNGEKTKLQKHGVQFSLLEQMENQLKTYLIFARSVNAEKSIKLYEESLEKISKIKEEKGDRDENNINIYEKYKGLQSLQNALFRHIN